MKADRDFRIHVRLPRTLRVFFGRRLAQEFDVQFARPPAIQVGTVRRAYVIETTLARYHGDVTQNMVIISDARV